MRTRVLSPLSLCLAIAAALACGDGSAPLVVDEAAPAPPAGEQPDDGAAEPPPVDDDALPAEPCAGCEAGEACTDGRDNDGDTYLDCRDFDCADVLPCGVPEEDEATCTDGLDNDGDGFSDCADWACRGLGACGLPEDTAGACSDGLDNDADFDVDCADAACRAQPVCDPSEQDAATCTDSVDNDGDSAVDCDDDACAGLSVCASHEHDEATCGDLVDNDGDGARDCADPGCAGASSCARDVVRVVQWNVRGLSDTTNGFFVIRDVLLRLDADVVCLNEVDELEALALLDLADAAGYPHVFQGSASSYLAAGMTNACLGRLPFASSRSWTSADLSTDALANDVGRDFVEVRVEVVPGARYVTVVTAHLKAGFDDGDMLRRHVEARRLASLVERLALERPDDGIVVLGDLNEVLGEEPEKSFLHVPQDVPSTFRLGADVAFPVAYDPLGALSSAGLQYTDPTHEDSATERGTRIPSGRRIDYVLYGRLALQGDQVYDACDDDGVDAPPAGDFLPLAGAPLSCGIMVEASDHWPVLADLALP